MLRHSTRTLKHATAVTTHTEVAPAKNDATKLSRLRLTPMRQPSQGFLQRWKGENARVSCGQFGVCVRYRKKDLTRP